MANIVRKRFSFWPVTYDDYSSRFYYQSSIPTLNPWALMKLKVDQKLATSTEEQKEIALALLEQADFFYHSHITASNYASKALLLYYYSMNLVKVYLIVRKFIMVPQRGFKHGLESGFETGSKADPLDGLGVAFEPTDTSKPKSQYMIFDEFLKSYACNINKKHKFMIKDLLPQIVVGHRLWAQAHSRKELFVPVEEIEFIRDHKKKTITTRGRILAKYIQRSTHVKFLKDCNIDSLALPFTDESPLKGYWYYEQNPLPYQRDATAQTKELVEQLRSKLWSVVTVQHPYRRFYLYKGSISERLPSQAAIYALMFFLGSVARYRPHFFNRILDSKYGPQIIEFVGSIPNQFLYLLASDLIEQDLERPAIA